MNIERRKHKRHSVKEGAYAAISPHSRKLGQIIDISMGGLAFNYYENEKTSELSEERSVFLSSLGYYVHDLPFETVEDYEIQKSRSGSSMKLKQRRIKFKNLSIIQRLDLEYFLRNNTVESVDKPFFNSSDK